MFKTITCLVVLLVKTTKATGVEGSSFEDYAYDSLSRITRGENDDSVVQFAYDSLGRRTSETQNGKTVSYTYDNLNNLRTITYPNNRVIEREFDLLNQIRRITSNTTEIARIDFTGRLLTGKHFGNGDVVNYTYDLPNRRPTGIEAKNQNNAIIAQFAYGYDIANFKAYEKRIHDANRGDVYLYDLLNRIREVKFNSTEPQNPETALFEKKKNYSIDHVDNLLKILENKDNVVTEILAEMDAQSSKLNQYTRFNQMDMAYDPNGNLKQKGTQQFAYDFKNRLTKVIDPSTTVTFQYDVFGRQTHELINPSTQLHFYYSGDQKIEERNESDTVIRQYIYGNGIDEIIRIDNYDNGNPIPYYFHSDEIGSVRAITDNAGNLVERINYDTFGKPTFTDFKTDPNNPVERNYSIIGNDILFQGREYDPNIALYNYRARYYDPMTGRFLQTDPMGYQDSMNQYQGFNLNPLNYLDPFGEWLTATHNRMAEIAFNRSKEMIEDKLKLFEPNYKKIPMLIPCRISTLQANFKAGANAPDWGFDYDGLIENKGDHFHAMYLANIGSAYELKQLIINTTRINVAKAKKLFFETNKDN